MPSQSYENNVFINCPFDTKYRKIIERLIFILTFYGYNVLISTNKSSAHDRLEEITKLILKSKFTIHDLSRHRAKSKGEFGRFNMPFELGIDFGCYKYLQSKKDKVFAILDDIPHEYDEYLSDMSGRDIFHHFNDPEMLFLLIPNWLTPTTGKMYDSPKYLKGYYTSWIIDYKTALKVRGHDLRKIGKIPLSVFLVTLQKWVPVWKRNNGYVEP